MVDSPHTSNGPSVGKTTGAAAAPAPDKTGATEGAWRRRSERVMLGVSIEVTATDLSGVRFTESTHTEMVSRHGASIVLSRTVSPEHLILLRRQLLEQEVGARVLGQLGIRAEGPVYGVAFSSEAPSFWGISFPAPGGDDEGLPRVLLMCGDCFRQRIFALNEIEFRVFEANQRLAHPCESCAKVKAWTPLPNKGSVGGMPQGKGPQDRQFQRTKVKMMACIQAPGVEGDVVQVLDLSRGGISFFSKLVYEKDTWINVSVPYTPGSANIFVASRVARKQAVGDEFYEYGVQYVKG